MSVHDVAALIQRMSSDQLRELSGYLSSDYVGGERLSTAHALSTAYNVAPASQPPDLRSWPKVTTC